MVYILHGHFKADIAAHNEKIFAIGSKSFIPPIQVNSDAYFTIVDMGKKTALTEKDMYSKTGFTSWEGMEVSGMPVYTIVRGQIIMEKRKLLGKPGCGRFTPGIAAG